MQFAHLEIALRKRGVINRSKRTLFNWAKIGVEGEDGKLIKLQSKRMNRDNLSSITYVREFLARLPNGIPDKGAEMQGGPQNRTYLKGKG